MKIGIDIGRVLICPRVNGVDDTSFLGCSVAEALPTPPAPGALEVIAELVRATEANCWLVSKCSKNVERKTRVWLEFIRFFDQTGLGRDQVRFCRHRADKAPISAELGLDAFLDDRSDVLVHMRGIVPHLLLFGEQKGRAPGWATPISDWGAMGRWFGRAAGP